MPGKDGTGPLGMGPCGKPGCVCRKRREAERDGSERKRPSKPGPGEGSRIH